MSVGPRSRRVNLTWQDWGFALAGALLACLVLVICVRKPASALLPHALDLSPPGPIPSVALLGRGGQIVRLEQFRGRWLLLYFGYTHCPDVCPAALNILAGELRQLGPSRRRLQVLFVSIDPMLDTPSATDAYARFFHPDFIGVTGRPPALHDLARAVGTKLQPTDRPLSPRSDRSHPTSIYVVDPTGKAVAAYPEDRESGVLAADFTPLLAVKGESP